MKDPIFIGSSVAIVTPFTNGMINYDRFHELIDWQIASGTSAITVCGTTGESSTLSSCEYEELLFKCVEFVDGITECEHRWTEEIFAVLERAQIEYNSCS